MKKPADRRHILQGMAALLGAALTLLLPSRGRGAARGSRRPRRSSIQVKPAPHSRKRRG